MDLTEIDGLSDNLLVKLRDSTSAADVRDLVFRLDGLYRGAQIKALTQDVTDRSPCGFRWKWGQGREQHYEVCTLLEGHTVSHRNDVTGVSRKLVVAEGEDGTSKRKAEACTCSWATRQAMSESNTLAGSHHDDTCLLYLRNFGELVNQTKPVSDRLHELTSNWKSSADSFESVAREGSSEEAFAIQLRACAGDLEAVLMEGGI